MPDADTRLRVDLAGLPLKNPILLAAGTAGTLDEMADVLDLSKVGAVVTKSITGSRREGNATWRIAPLRAGMLNAIGLANVGLEGFLKDYAPRIPAVPAAVVVSIAGFSTEEYVASAAAIDALGTAAAVELNVSCPNVHGGCEFGSDPALLADLVTAVRPALARTPMILKLPPVTGGVTSIVDLARAAIYARGGGGGPASRPGADALTISNTLPAMAIDVHTRRPVLSNVTGGLSGSALHPVALRLVHEAYRGVAKSTATPIIGAGGVLTWEDAAEFILAGATAVQIGTGLLADPRAPLKVAKGLARWVQEQQCGSIAQLIGAATI